MSTLLARRLFLLLVLFAPPAVAQLDYEAGERLRQMTVAQVTGQILYTQSGTEIGQVERVVVDAERMPRLVLKVGGFFGLGAQSVALPISRVLPTDRGLLLVGPYDSTELARRFPLSPDYQMVPAQRTLAEAAEGMAAPVEAAKLGFEHLDRNGDGYLDPAEAERHQALTSSWPALDENQDGRLDPAEFAAFRNAPVAESE